MFHNILVAVDGSAHARAAVRQAADIAQTQNARLTLLTAYSSFLPWPGVMAPGVSQATFDEMAETARAKAQADLDEAAAMVPAAVTTRTMCVDADPGDAINGELSTGAYDLVVVGSRGRSDVASIVLGSVSHRVIHQSHVPVLVVHVAETVQAANGHTRTGTERPVPTDSHSGY